MWRLPHLYFTLLNQQLLPLSFYPVNELWNLLPVDRAFNQRTNRRRRAGARLAADGRSAALSQALR